MKRLSFFVILFISSALAAQQATTLSEVVVTGKAEDLVGVAPAASQGRASAEDLLSRPVLRRSEILEIIPGVITTQHAGGGKATQYFLRGFNLDHGTDFATSLEGMPLNLRTHAHGQGYTDLNGLIPELISKVDYAKGPYTAANGDLSTAGSADFTLQSLLEPGIVSFEIGEHAYYRGLIAGSIGIDGPLPGEAPAPPGGKDAKAVAPVTPEQFLTYALEFNSYEGPFDLSEDFMRWNGLLRWFAGDDDDHLSVTLMGYRGEWTSSDQIPRRAVEDGSLPRFGHIDPFAGGESQRYSLNSVWRATEGSTVTTANVYAIYYDLDLFSNFTYFQDDPVRGDEFEQAERRWIFGGNIARTWLDEKLLGHDATYTVGLQTRHDLISGIGLYHTQERHRVGTVRQDDVYEGNIGIFGEGTVHWTPWMRTIAGLRGDVFCFDTQSSTLGGNEGDTFDAMVSPKFTMVFGPWHDTEIYLNYGMGFHSNDARGVNTTVDPSTGERVSKVDPLVRTQGAEIGLRTNAVPTLTSTLSLFWLQSDSELVYVGDAGTNEPGPGSERYGIEFANYWRPAPWFTLDAEFAITHARFTDSGNADYIPNSIPWMFSGGVTLGAQQEEDGFFASLRARAFARRPLIEDNSVKGKSSFLVNAGIGYRYKAWEAALECLNLFDREDNDIEYFYTSRLPGEAAAGVDDIHFHPTEPRMFRLRLTYKF